MSQQQYAQVGVPEDGGLLNTAGTSYGFLSRSNLRPLSVMFGIGQVDPPPYGLGVIWSPPLLVQRVKHNVSLFYLNYMAVFVVS